MTTYREIAATEDDPEKPITSQLAKAWTDNLLAGLEGDPTAPVNAGNWHPYNKTMNNGSETGRIWSMAVDGAVATITTPNFVDGWDYAFLFDKVLASGSATLNVNMYRETGAAYAGVAATAVSPTTAAAITGLMEFIGPRLVRNAHFTTGTLIAQAVADATVGVGVMQSGAAGARHATAQKILRMQFSVPGFNFQGTGAAIYMLRRRNVAA